MIDHARRRFLADVGKGMLVASLGPTVAADLGLAPAFAEPGDKPPPAAELEPLVYLMQNTPAARLLPDLVDRIRRGTDLRTLVAAAALANARMFNGGNYEGFHNFMALAPAYQMAQELPPERRPLPVLKVLYRNSDHLYSKGGPEVQQPVAPEPLTEDQDASKELRDAVRGRDLRRAEGVFAAVAQGGPADAFNVLQAAVHDDLNVHRVVLPWRAWVLLDLAGPEHAHTLLRQSVHYCIRESRVGYSPSGFRTQLPLLLDFYHLLDRPPGQRQPEDAWVEHLAQTVYASSGPDAADAVAAALAEGMAPDAVGEAVSLAANQLVLRDPGRAVGDGNKYSGSVHGDSVGVHAQDAANAWRNIARVSNPRNAIASLLAAAYHTAGQKGRANRQPLPWAEHLEQITGQDPRALLDELDVAVRTKDQAVACAAVQRYGTLGHAPRPVFDLLLRYAVSENGALHAEKYYRTVTEEFAATRPAFRWRHLVALARVTASEYGVPAAGYAEACRLLKV
jgi:hypothetical protein